MQQLKFLRPGRHRRYGEVRPAGRNELVEGREVVRRPGAVGRMPMALDVLRSPTKKWQCHSVTAHPTRHLLPLEEHLPTDAESPCGSPIRCGTTGVTRSAGKKRRRRSRPSVSVVSAPDAHAEHDTGKQEAWRYEVRVRAAIVIARLARDDQLPTSAQAARSS